MAKYNRDRNERYLDRVYVGRVKRNSDAKMAGRIAVWIAEFDSREDDENSWIVCDYCSPFAGATNHNNNSPHIVDTMQDTQTSYGFWAVPPDINNEVLVTFAAGKINRAFWIGSLYKEYMIQGVPAAAASKMNKQNAGAVTNPDKAIPVSEYNKWDRTADTGKELDPRRPWQESRTRGIGEQGLLQDHIRGLSSSSAMRESPSQVFGMSTPGPIDPRKPEKGPGVARLGGNSFVMDDGDADGNDEYIGFKTRSGASIRLDETNGLIYFINKLGTSWIQMDEDGNVDIFGAESISMRTERDFNLRADGDINLEAGHNINMKAAQDTDEEHLVVGEGSGVGGNIFMQAINDLHLTVDDDAYITVTRGDFDLDVQAGSRREYIKVDDDKHVDRNVTSYIVGNESQSIGGTRTEHLVGDENITIDSNRIYTITGNEDNIINGNRTESIGSSESEGTPYYSLKVNGDFIEQIIGDFDTTIRGDQVEKINGSVSTSSTAYILDADGKQWIADTFHADKNISCSSDIISASQSLESLFQHVHQPGSYFVSHKGSRPVKGQSAPFGKGGPKSIPVGGQAADPILPEFSIDSIPAAIADPALMIPMNFKQNILLGFDGDAIIKLGNDQKAGRVPAASAPKTVTLPDYWNRSTQEILTIGNRYITYEPCADHINPGNELPPPSLPDPIQPVAPEDLPQQIVHGEHPGMDPIQPVSTEPQAIVVTQGIPSPQGGTVEVLTSSVSVIDSGTGYTDDFIPEVEFGQGTPARSAAAVCEMAGPYDIEVDDPAHVPPDPIPPDYDWPQVTLEGLYTISSIDLTDLGSGYGVIPAVNLVGGSPYINAIWTVAGIFGFVTAIDLVEGTDDDGDPLLEGGWYYGTPTVQIAPPSSSVPRTATGHAVMSSDHSRIISIVIDNHGFYPAGEPVPLFIEPPLPAEQVPFIDPPDVTPYEPRVRAAGVTITRFDECGYWIVTGVEITEGGEGYDDGAPAVFFDEGFETASAISQIVDGVVVSVTVLDGGKYAGSKPGVTFAQPGADSTVPATATGQPIFLTTPPDEASVIEVQMTSSGDGYAGVPQVIFSTGETINDTARGTAQMADGMVIGVTIDKPGSYLDSQWPVAEVSFTGPEQAAGLINTEILQDSLGNDFVRVTGITLTNVGYGYTEDSYVIFSESTYAGPAFASYPLIKALYDDETGAIYDFDLEHGGSFALDDEIFMLIMVPPLGSYPWVPEQPDQTDALGTPVVTNIGLDNNIVDDVTIDYAGRGYTILPSPLVHVTSPLGGTPAEGTTTVYPDGSIATISITTDGVFTDAQAAELVVDFVTLIPATGTPIIDHQGPDINVCTGITLVSGGYGYLAAPLARVRPAGGFPVTTGETTIDVLGRVDSINMLNTRTYTDAEVLLLEVEFVVFS